MNINRILCTDAYEGLKKLPDASIDCVVTSPPYWATRDYGVAITKWPDGSESALGLEKRFVLYIEHLCLLFDEVQRVLKPTGACWVNLGDTYAGSGGGYSREARARARKNTDSPDTTWSRPGYDHFAGRSASSYPQPVKKRSLCMIPARFAIAMCERGWILRNDIVWHKPNHMPASVKNRLTCSWEHLLFFVKQPKYFFDLDSVRIPRKIRGTSLFRPVRDVRLRQRHDICRVGSCPNPGEPHSAHLLDKNPGDFWSISPEMRRLGDIIGVKGALKFPQGNGWMGHRGGGAAKTIRDNDPRWLSPAGKNPADVLKIGTAPSSFGHFAMFPEKLIELPIRAGCPARVCKRCGTPKLSRKVFSPIESPPNTKNAVETAKQTQEATIIEILGCGCRKGFEPGIVLDPFMGAGTTAAVAQKFGRSFIGFELNPEYVAMANRRLRHAVKNQSNRIARRPAS